MSSSARRDSPGPRVAVLPGIPAIFWGSAMTWLAPAWFVVCILMVIGRLSRIEVFQVMTVTGCVIAHALVLADFGLLMLRRRHERFAGYTTLWAGGQVVPHVDWKTGLQIRAAGSPQPTSEERRALVAKRRRDREIARSL